MKKYLLTVPQQVKAKELSSAVLATTSRHTSIQKECLLEFPRKRLLSYLAQKPLRALRTYTMLLSWLKRAKTPTTY